MSNQNIMAPRGMATKVPRSWLFGLREVGGFSTGWQLLPHNVRGRASCDEVPTRETARRDDEPGLILARRPDYFWHVAHGEPPLRAAAVFPTAFSGHGRYYTAARSSGNGFRYSLRRACKKMHPVRWCEPLARMYCYACTCWLIFSISNLRKCWTKQDFAFLANRRYRYSILKAETFLMKMSESGVYNSQKSQISACFRALRAQLSYNRC